jgi:hypothetical protein
MRVRHITVEILADKRAAGAVGLLQIVPRLLLIDAVTLHHPLQPLV